MTQVAVRTPAAAAVSAVLPPRFSAVHEARALVRSALSDWHADDIADDVTLVVSELVANALMHGLDLPLDGDGASAESTPGRSGQVELQMLSTGTYVICVVRDPSPQPPVRRAPDETALGGRGLQLIESLSHSWGWTPSAGAKSVWAIFPLSTAAHARSGADQAPAVALRAS